MGRTALHHAAQGGHTETAALLLDRGADIKAKDYTESGYGRTALQLAALWGHTETAALLLDRGADIEAKAYYGQTALHYAARGGKAETAALLLDRGADIEAKDLLWLDCSALCCTAEATQRRRHCCSTAALTSRLKTKLGGLLCSLLHGLATQRRRHCCVSVVQGKRTHDQ